MSGERERLVAVVPIASGWRAAYAYVPEPDSDLDAMADGDLYYMLPVACLAHIESIPEARVRFSEDGDPSLWHEDLEASIVPLTTWGSGDSLDWYTNDRPILLLGPGQTVDTASLRSLAVAQIRLAWLLLARARGAAT